MSIVSNLFAAIGNKKTENCCKSAIVGSTPTDTSQKDSVFTKSFFMRSLSAPTLHPHQTDTDHHEHERRWLRYGGQRCNKALGVPVDIYTVTDNCISIGGNVRRFIQ